MKDGMEKHFFAWDEAGRELDECVAVEEPLSLVVDGYRVSVMMRTPGDDRRLVLGFLRTEGVIRSIDEVRRIDFDAEPGEARVFLAEGVEWEVERLRRHGFAASSCGMCGKVVVEGLEGSTARDLGRWRVERDFLEALPGRLREGQVGFDRTGGMHGVGWFPRDGEAGVVAEDVGRHNAMDKVIGRLMEMGQDPAEGVMMLSGRVSYEMVQKAGAVGVGVVAAISAVSSMAVEAAKRDGMTLVGFLRPPRFRVLSGRVGAG